MDAYTETRSQLAALIPELSRDDGATVARLLAASQVVRMRRGDFVFRLGDMCEAFLVLLDGRVRVQLISPTGREVTLYRISPGGSCILTTSCLLSDEHYPAEAIAELASVLLRLDDECVQKVTHQDIAVELGTAREVVSRHLKRIEAAGSVQLGRGHIRIIDRSRIEAIATQAVGD